MDQLDAIYQSMLERKCDQSGLQTWSGMMNNPATIGAVADAISTSPEYQRKFGDVKVPNEANLTQKCCVGRI